jgi:hypothetical protein
MGELDIPDLTPLGVEGAATGAGAFALYWTMGPSLHAVGKVFGEWTEFRLRNLLGIGERISARLPKDPQPDGQGINPRAAKLLIEEGSWIEDDLHQEYLAGLFVASRSPDGVSDDGAYYARIVAGLTASQVRMHYGVYRSYYDSRASDNLQYRFNGSADDRRALSVWAPREAYFRLASGGASETDSGPFAAAVHGLEREGLITECAPPRGERNSTHVVTIPSLLGAVIYHKAMGYTPPGIDAIRSDREQLRRIDPDYAFATLDPEPPTLEGAWIGLS